MTENYEITLTGASSNISKIKKKKVLKREATEKLSTTSENKVTECYRNFGMPYAFPENENFHYHIQWNCIDVAATCGGSCVPQCERI